MVRSRMPSAPARPRRSATPGELRRKPVSRASTSVRLLPDTAMRWSVSVARNASSSSGGTREVSATTSAGSNARASGESPSLAVRSPAPQPPPASRCDRAGPTRDLAGAHRRSHAPRPLYGPRHAAAAPGGRGHADGWTATARARPSASLPALGWTVTRTGALVVVAAPSGPVTRSASASRTTDAGASAAPRTRGRASRGSPVTVTSAVASAYSRAERRHLQQAYVRPIQSGDRPRGGPAQQHGRHRPCRTAPTATRRRLAAERVAAAARCGLRRCPDGLKSRARHRATSQPSAAAPSAPAAEAGRRVAAMGWVRAAVGRGGGAEPPRTRPGGPGMGCATPSSTRCRVRASPDEQRCRHEGGNRADESHQMGRCVQGERRGRPARPGPGPRGGGRVGPPGVAVTDRAGDAGRSWTGARGRASRPSSAGPVDADRRTGAHQMPFTSRSLIDGAETSVPAAVGSEDRAGPGRGRLPGGCRAVRRSRS
ncbi:hypothetical protein SANTM175S_03843 [Streptomyces antimycoticus]